MFYIELNCIPNSVACEMNADALQMISVLLEKSAAVVS